MQWSFTDDDTYAITAFSHWRLCGVWWSLALLPYFTSNLWYVLCIWNLTQWSYQISLAHTDIPWIIRLLVYTKVFSHTKDALFGSSTKANDNVSKINCAINIIIDITGLVHYDIIGACVLSQKMHKLKALYLIVSSMLHTQFQLGTNIGYHTT